MNLSRDITGLPEGCSLNEMQKMCVPYIDDNVNLVVVAGTNTGKSTIPVMVAHKYLTAKARKKIVYVAPMKALVEEKRRSWSKADHPFSKYKQAVITGDYAALAADAEAEDADIITITPESLASRIRNAGTKSSWLDSVGMLCIDEFHLIGSENRGATLEACLIEFSYRCPNTQLVLLSGTVPNYEELAAWVGKLNNLSTELIQTEWRAVPLHKHYIHVPFRNKAEREEGVISAVLRLCDKHVDDKALIVFHNKMFGQRVVADIKKDGHISDFHNADKSKVERESIENAFSASKDPIKLGCTTTLTTGMNLPARIVIETDAEAGGQDIKAYDLNQAAGRAGRMGLDPEGDAYFIIPAKDKDTFNYHVKRIERGETIQSQMRTVPEIALHFLGAVHLGRIRTHQDFYDWYKNTLKFHQNPMNDAKMQRLLENIVKDMAEKKMLVEDEGVLELKQLGKICTQMALDPYYLYELSLNFHKMFSKTSFSSTDIAKALAYCTKVSVKYLSNDVKNVIPESVRKSSKQEYWVPMTIYSLGLNGDWKNIPSRLYSAKYAIYQDIERIATTLARVSEECFRWGEKDLLMGLPYMVEKGYSADMARLMAQGAPPSKAKELLRRGITDMKRQKRDLGAVIKEVMNSGK